MIAELELQEYLDQVRQEVCSRCVERPHGGPPCGPLGKPCGVELHLPQLIEAVRQVHDNRIDPYLQTNRRDICPTCPFYHSSHCPCPMDSLAVLVVGAIETVEQRHQKRREAHERIAGLTARGKPEMVEIARLYEEAAGTWTGCDWPTHFGPTCLNLENWSAAEATAHALEVERSMRSDWEAAADWLEEIERRAAQAEDTAFQAVQAAAAGDWSRAADQAQQAWALEFSTGRTFRGQAATWKPLFEVVRLAAWAHFEESPADAHRHGITTLCDC